MEGTSLLRFKRAYITALQGRIANVVYGSPVEAMKVLGENGSGVAAWFADEHEATIEVVVFGPQWFDETITATLVVQGVGRTTDDDQEAIDERTTEALGAAIGILAADPSLGLEDDTIQMFAATPSGWRNRTGPLNTLRAGHFELDVEIHARLKLS
jgi:hypothetical protein